MLKGKVDLNYMNTNVVYIKKTKTKKAKQNIYLILHNILFTPIWKNSQHIVPNTQETSSYQIKSFL